MAHPWLRSFSVLSNHKRTATALPSRHCVKMSSISAAMPNVFYSYGAPVGIDAEPTWGQWGRQPEQFSRVLASISSSFGSMEDTERWHCSHTLSVKSDKTRGCVLTHLFKLLFFFFLDRPLKKCWVIPPFLETVGRNTLNGIVDLALGCL